VVVRGRVPDVGVGRDAGGVVLVWGVCCLGHAGRDHRVEFFLWVVFDRVIFNDGIVGVG
jgi:hypothetical protein